jgi:hypothetical protein
MTDDRKVVSLVEHREKYQPDTEVDTETAACADCANVWFILRGRRNDPPIAASGAITLDQQGMPRAYIGEPVCCECGKAWAPAGG